LDRLFYNSGELDLFILFGSVTSVVGNAGQANYCAANMFMASLCKQRQKRGLAASIIFITAEELVVPLSETDLHAAFSEAIVSGRPDSGTDSSLIVGIGDGREAPWRNVPRFASLISYLSQRSSNNDRGTEQPLIGRRRSVRQELASALDISFDEALSVMIDSFTAQLGIILQTDASNFDKSAPLLALGIDSLVAVEVRSWFLKELSVEITVLDILGHASLSSICRDAVVIFNESREKVEQSSSQSEDVDDEHRRSSAAKSDDVGLAILCSSSIPDNTSSLPRTSDSPSPPSTLLLK
ncbi:hypothetical protein F4777DRAFT_599084, partial [Nemania sp. FL0916]